MGEGEVGPEIQDKKLHRFRLLPTMHHDLFLSLVQKHHLFSPLLFPLQPLTWTLTLYIKNIGWREDSKQTNSIDNRKKKGQRKEKHN